MQGSNNGTPQSTNTSISAAALLQSFGAQELIQRILQQKTQAVANLAAVIHQRYQQQQQHSSTENHNHEQPRSSSSSSSNSPNEPQSPIESELKSPNSPEIETPPISRPSSSRANINGRPQRKLKIYGVDEKLDIIDYAKVIGNRAAGREYNVAESSIREWRKNETKLRMQAESTHSASAPNPEKEEFHNKLSDELISYINSTIGVTWLMVRDKCQELWKIHGSQYEEGSSIMHLQGWLSRFLAKAKSEDLIPEIAPPIAMPNTGISSSSSSLLNSVTMVRTESPVDYPSTISSPPPMKRSRYSTNSRVSTQQTSSEIDPPKSRRKCPPKKILDATLKTSSISPLDLTTKKDQNSNEENKTDETNDEKESKTNVLEVC